MNPSTHNGIYEYWKVTFCKSSCASISVFQSELQSLPAEQLFETWIPGTTSTFLALSTTSAYAWIEIYTELAQALHSYKTQSLEHFLRNRIYRKQQSVHVTGNHVCISFFKLQLFRNAAHALLSLNINWHQPMSKEATTFQGSGPTRSPRLDFGWC